MSWVAANIAAFLYLLQSTLRPLRLCRAFPLPPTIPYVSHVCCVILPSSSSHSSELLQHLIIITPHSTPPNLPALPAHQLLSYICNSFSLQSAPRHHLLRYSLPPHFIKAIRNVHSGQILNRRLGGEKSTSGNGCSTWPFPERPVLTLSCLRIFHRRDNRERARGDIDRCCESM